MFWKILRGAFLIAVIGVLVIVGIAVWRSFNPVAENGEPSVKMAGYEIEIVNTGRQLYSQSIEQLNPGAPNGKRIFALKSYWELNGSKYEIRNHSLLLDEKYFGIIDVRRR